MLRRAVVSRGSACVAFENARNAVASSPRESAIIPVARSATALFASRRAPASRAATPSSRSPFARWHSASSASAEASPGLRTSTSRACRMALSTCPESRSAGDVERARRERRRVALDEVSEPVGGGLVLPAPLPHLRERERDLLRVRRPPSRPSRARPRLRRGRRRGRARRRGRSAPPRGTGRARSPRAGAARPGRVPAGSLAADDALHHLGDGDRVRRRERRCWLRTPGRASARSRPRGRARQRTAPRAEARVTGELPSSVPRVPPVSGRMTRAASRSRRELLAWWRRPTVPPRASGSRSARASAQCWSNGRRTQSRASADRAHRSAARAPRASSPSTGCRSRARSPSSSRSRTRRGSSPRSGTTNSSICGGTPPCRRPRAPHGAGASRSDFANDSYVCPIW